MVWPKVVVTISLNVTAQEVEVLVGALLVDVPVPVAVVIVPLIGVWLAGNAPVGAAEYVP